MAANKFYLSDAIENIKNKCSELKNSGIDVSFVSIVGNEWISTRKTKIIIHCNKHDIDYEVRYEEFLSSRHKGCIECKKENLSFGIKRYKTEKEVIAAIEKKIDEENLNLEFCGFINKYSTLIKTKIEVCCIKHGITGHPTIEHFLRKGFMCKECVKEYNSQRQESTKEEVYNKISIIKEEYKYDYTSILTGEYGDKISLCENPKIKIICNDHGPFYRNLQTLLSPRCDCTCSECKKLIEKDQRKEKLISEIDKTIKERKRLGYDLEFCGFVNEEVISTNDSRVIIKCNKHNSLSEINYYNFVNGFSCGCTTCSGKSSIYERECRRVLKEDFPNIQVIEQYKIPHLLEYDFGTTFSNTNIYIDFYIPDKNLFIEYNGEQHYHQNTKFHETEEEFIDQRNRDMYIKNYCSANNIKLLVISYKDQRRIEEIIRTYLLTGEDISTKTI